MTASVQLGNGLGVTTAGDREKFDAIATEITADGANTFTASDVEQLRVGDKIQVRTKTTDVVLGERNITVINPTTRVVTYDGADMAVVAGTHAVYKPDFYHLNVPGKNMLRQLLKNINAGYYTDTRLNGLTENDMIYAARVHRHSVGGL